MQSAVDGHQHFWNPPVLRLPWLRPEHGILNGAFEPADLEPLLAEAGVARTILVQSGDFDGDTDFMLERARAHSWIAAVVGWLPLESPGRTAIRLDELAGEPKLRGVRHLLHEEEDPHWVLQPSVFESLALVAARGLVFEVPAVFPRHLADMPLLARSLPGLTVVIDHLGKPPLDCDADDFGEWARQLRAAAALPNVAAKISGLNTATSSTTWTAAAFEPAVEVALDAFGPGRLLCGSDWPVALLNGDYARVWRETRRVLETLAPGEQEQVLALTAAHLYQLPASPDDRC